MSRPPIARRMLHDIVRTAILTWSDPTACMLRMKAFPQAGHCRRAKLGTINSPWALIDGPLLPWDTARPSILVEADSIGR